MRLDLAWDLSDTFNGLMAIPNLIGVLALSPVVCKITKNYVDRRIRNLDKEPMLSAFPEIQKMQSASLKESD
jgi:AGCS family alanine or glycine:cation symporter